MAICKICNTNFDDYRRLSKHIRDKHTIKIKDYYDLYIKSVNEGKCKFCDNATAYINISKGYTTICPSMICKSEYMKEIRYDNSLNIEKHNKFVDKVAKNQKRIWAERKESGEDIIIREKISLAITGINSLLSDDERKLKFSLKYKISNDEYEKWKKDVMLNTGSHLFWKTATHEQKQKVIVRKMGTMFANINKMKLDYTNSKQFHDYDSVVRYMTEITYHKYKLELDPKSIRSNEYHLDHIISVKAGFLLDIDPVIISSKVNLRLITKKENLSKSCKCDMTIEELMEKYNNDK